MGYYKRLDVERQERRWEEDFNLGLVDAEFNSEWNDAYELAEFNEAFRQLEEDGQPEPTLKLETLKLET